MRSLGRWLLAGLVLLVGRGRRADAGDRPGEPVAPRAELLVVALLGLASLAAIGFVVDYALDADTQILGLSIGLALAFLAAACIVAGKRFIPSEEEEEPYGQEPNEVEQEEVVGIVRGADRRITRKRLLTAAAGGSALTVGAALVVPAASLGPFLGVGELYETPWSSGRRLVDRRGRPIAAADLEPDSFLTAYAEDVSRRNIGAALIVVRVPLDELHLPDDRRDWAPDGIVAYSKICTHAGCAVAMYRAPVYPPTSPSPALVCPCHYSTFDARSGGTVIFGPAGRDLPQLPLLVDGAGHLRAAGNFSGPIGPSWWGVRLKDAR